MIEQRIDDDSVEGFDPSPEVKVDHLSIIDKHLWMLASNELKQYQREELIAEILQTIEYYGMEKHVEGYDRARGSLSGRSNY